MKGLALQMYEEDNGASFKWDTEVADDGADAQDLIVCCGCELGSEKYEPLKGTSAMIPGQDNLFLSRQHMCNISSAQLRWFIRQQPEPWNFEAVNLNETYLTYTKSLGQRYEASLVINGVETRLPTSVLG